MAQKKQSYSTPFRFCVWTQAGISGSIPAAHGIRNGNQRRSQGGAASLARRPPPPGRLSSGGLGRPSRPGPRQKEERRQTGHRLENREEGIRVRVLSLIHISEPTRLGMISYAVFCL